jgi:hypothetical protein
MTTDPDYEELERVWKLGTRKPPARPFRVGDLALALLLALTLLADWFLRCLLWGEVTRYARLAARAVQSSSRALLGLPPDFGWCRCCETYHDLDVACRPYLEEQGEIFPDGKGGH